MKYQPGDHFQDSRFIVKGYPELLTENEILAWRNLQLDRKLPKLRSAKMRRVIREALYTGDEAVRSLLADGETAFARRILQRVLASKPRQLGTCPDCGSLCRTASACLCPHCAHTWYESRHPREKARLAS